MPAENDASRDENVAQDTLKLMKLVGDGQAPSPATSDYVAELETKLDRLQQDLDLLREEHDCRQYHVERVEEELKLAARLQRDFLPKSLPNHGNVQFNRLYRPAGHVSGDLYDVRRLDEEWCGVYLADAIGHGMPAALLAMFMHNALATKKIDASGYELLDSAEAMRRLNETLCGQGLTHATFATALYARVHLQSGLVDLARGGHPYPLLIRAGGDIEEVGEDGALLGIMPREKFTPVQLQLRPGDKLVCFTDGVETAFKPDGAVSDLKYWTDAVRERRDMPADTLLADLWQDMAGRTPEDDVTVVTLEMT